MDPIPQKGIRQPTIVLIFTYFLICVDPVIRSTIEPEDKGEWIRLENNL